jgi:guanylate kinase
LASEQKIIIVAAPSGAGKTSVVKHLLQELPEQLGFSISCATRSPRANEKNGVDYYFISAEEFKSNIEQNAFAEWEMVYEGKYYGTPKSELERIWSLGKTPLLDVDVKGGLNVKSLYPKQTLALFIEPPSIEELKNRLVKRGTENAESLQARIEKANYELSFKNQFDHIIVNDQLEQACAKAKELITAFLTL